MIFKKKVIEINIKKCGYNGEIICDYSTPDKTPKKQLDISKIMRLGWQPKTIFDEGLNLTIKIIDI